MGILQGEMLREEGGVSIVSEVGYLALDFLQIALIPGEMLQELVIGGRLPEHRLPHPERADEPLLFDLMPGGIRLVFGLANDEIGYILNDNDYCMIFFDDMEPFGDHYQETIAFSRSSGSILMAAFEELVADK